MKSIVTKTKNKHLRRSLLSLRHYEFRQRLIHKIRETKSRLIICHEPYTSKTCTKCGIINNIGSSKHYKCKECKLEIDRDVNGARNIFLRVIMGGPWSYKIICACDEGQLLPVLNTSI